MSDDGIFRFEDAELHWADYVVFGGFLLTISVVGIVIGIVNRRRATNAEFLKAGSDMHFIPVAFSIQASFLSAIFIVSIPAESYNFGIGYAYLILSYFIAFPLIGKLFLPVFFKLKITSAYEYLELRFNKTVRTACAITFLLEMILYISVVIYTPALTMQTVMPLPTYACILLVSGICIIYTVVGGMRATIWNDLIQMTIVMASLSMIIGFGHKETGSLREVYEIAKNGSRLEFNIFKPNPTTRTTFWSQVIGGTFLNFAMYAASQTTIQKALSTSSIKNAQNAMIVVSVLMTITLSLVMWLGILMYAYYSQCDPQLSGQVEKADQIVPLFMMAVLGDYPGLPGLFLAATFSGALSSVSGGLNSMSAVVLLDLIEPVYKHYKRTNLPERISVILTRCLVLLLGVLVTVLAFVVPLVGDLILTLALSIFGMMGGPICGVLAAGLFMPCVTSWGALVGLLVGLTVTMWVGIGTMVAGPPLPYLPHSVEGCPVDNSTFGMTSTAGYPYTEPSDWSITPTQPSEEDDVFGFYKLSYMYYGLVAIGSSMITAVLVSVITGVKKDTPNEYIYSCADTCCRCCPRKVRDCCRCGSLPPQEDLDEAVEVIEVHFKKKAGSGVPGLDHPVRQVSFVLTNNLSEDRKTFPTETGAHSIHTALYRHSFNLEDDILEEPEVVVDNGITFSAGTKLGSGPHNIARHDSGIHVNMNSSEDSSHSSSTATKSPPHSTMFDNDVDEVTYFGAEQSVLAQSGDYEATTGLGSPVVGLPEVQVVGVAAGQADAHSRSSSVASSMELQPLKTSSRRNSPMRGNSSSVSSRRRTDSRGSRERQEERSPSPGSHLSRTDSTGSRERQSERSLSPSIHNSKKDSTASEESNVIRRNVMKSGSVASDFSDSSRIQRDDSLSNREARASDRGSRRTSRGSDTLQQQVDRDQSLASKTSSVVGDKFERSSSFTSKKSDVIESKLERSGSIASRSSEVDEPTLERASSDASKGTDVALDRSDSVASRKSSISGPNLERTSSIASKTSDTIESMLDRSPGIVSGESDVSEQELNKPSNITSIGQSDISEQKLESGTESGDNTAHDTGDHPEPELRGTNISQDGDKADNDVTSLLEDPQAESDENASVHSRDPGSRSRGSSVHSHDTGSRSRGLSVHSHDPGSRSRGSSVHRLDSRSRADSSTSRSSSHTSGSRGYVNEGYDQSTDL